MTEYNRSDALWGRFTIDRQTVEMGLLLAFVTGVAGLLAFQAGPIPDTGPPDAFGEGASADAAAGATWAIAEIVFAASVLGLVLVYRRLPEWLQDAVRITAVASVFMYVGVRAATLGVVEAAYIGLVTLVFGYKTLERFDIWWIVNNFLAIAIAVFVGVMIGNIFGVAGMVLALLALTAYDHVFANKQSWMFTIGGVMMKTRLPLIFVRPDSWRLSWDEVIASFEGAADQEVDEEDDEDVSWGLGTADLMLPAGFVAAVASTPSGVVATFGPVVLAVLVGAVIVAAARLRFEMLTRGSGAGLPALTTALLVAYAPLFVAAVLV